LQAPGGIEGLIRTPPGDVHPACPPGATFQIKAAGALRPGPLQPLMEDLDPVRPGWHACRS